MSPSRASQIPSVLKLADKAGLWSPTGYQKKPTTIEVGMLGFDALERNDGRTNIDGYPNGEQWMEYRVHVLGASGQRQIAHQFESSSILTIDLPGPWIDAIEPALAVIQVRIDEKQKELAQVAAAEARKLAAVAREAEKRTQRELAELAAQFKANHEPAEPVPPKEQEARREQLRAGHAAAKAVADARGYQLDPRIAQAREEAGLIDLTPARPSDDPSKVIDLRELRARSVFSREAVLSALARYGAGDLNIFETIDAILALPIQTDDAALDRAWDTYNHELQRLTPSWPTKPAERVGTRRRAMRAALKAIVTGKVS